METIHLYLITYNNFHRGLNLFLHLVIIADDNMVGVKVVYGKG